MAKHIHRITSENDPNTDQEDSKEQASSTNQYFRLANAVIKEKIDKLKHLQDSKKIFPDIGILQNKTMQKLDLDKLNLKYITEGDVKDLIAHIEDDYEKMKDRLLCQELIVEKTKDEISAKRKEIDEIKEKLKEMLEKQQKLSDGATDPIAILKEELNMKNLKDQIRKN